MTYTILSDFFYTEFSQIRQRCKNAWFVLLLAVAKKHFVKYMIHKTNSMNWMSCNKITQKHYKIRNVSWRYFSVSTVNYRCWGWGQGSGKALMCYYLYCAPFLQKKKKRRQFNRQTTDCTITIETRELSNRKRRPYSTLLPYQSAREGVLNRWHS